MEINFHGEVDKTRLRRAIALLNSPKKGAAVVRITLGIGILVLFIALIYKEISGSAAAARIEIRTLVVNTFALLLTEYVALFPYINTLTMTNRIWKQSSSYKSLKGVVTERGVSIYGYNSIDTLHEIVWNRYFKLNTTSDLISLLTNDGEMTLLARDFFDSDDDWQKVIKIVEFNVKVTK